MPALVQSFTITPPLAGLKREARLELIRELLFLDLGKHGLQRLNVHRGTRSSRFDCAR